MNQTNVEKDKPKPQVSQIAANRLAIFRCAFPSA
jgi:hypothetical protein